MLSRILDLRAGEGRTLAVLGGHLFLVLAANTLLATAAEALFLAVYPYSWIPYTYLAGAFWTVVAAMAYGRVKARCSPQRTSQVTVGASLAALVILGCVLQWAPAAGPFVLQMVTPAFGVLGGMESASLIARALETRQARRLYPSISSLGGIGATAGAFAVAWAIGGVGPLGMLALAGLFLLGALALAGRVQGIESRREQAAPAGWGEVLRNRFTLALVTLVCLSGVLTTCVKFQLSACVKESMPAAEIAGYLGNLYGALNAVSIVFGFLVTRRLVRNLGVGGSLLVYPLLLLVCGVGGVLVPGLAVTSSALFLERLFRQNLQRPLLNIATMPLPGGLGVRTSLALRGAVETPAIAVTSIALLLSAANVPWETISYLIAGVGLAAVGCVAIARPRYARALIAALHARRFQAPQAIDTLSVLSADARAVLREELRSTDSSAVELALTWLDGDVDTDTVALIQSCWAGWPMASRRAAVGVLGRSSEPAAVEFIESLRDADAAELRAARWTADNLRVGAVDWSLGLRDPAPAVVRAAVTRWVAAGRGAVDLPLATLSSWLESDDGDQRASAVIALLASESAAETESEPRPALDVVLRAHPEVALATAAVVPCPPLLPYLLETLASPGDEAARRAALSLLGERAIPSLVALIEDPRRGPAALRILMHGMIERTPTAAAAFAAACLHVDVAVREGVRRALAGVLHGPEAILGVREQIRDALRAAPTDLAAAAEFECAAGERLWPARAHPDPVVAREAQASCAAGVGRLFTLLDAMEEGKPYRRVELALLSGSVRARGFAVEALDEMLPSRWRVRVLAMLDSGEVPDEARATAAVLSEPMLAAVLRARQGGAEPRTARALALQGEPLFEEFRVDDLVFLLTCAARFASGSAPIEESDSTPGSESRPAQSLVSLGVLSEALLRGDGVVAGIATVAVWETLSHRPQAAVAWLHGAARCLTPEAPEAAVATATALSLASRVGAEDPGGSPVRDGEIWRRGLFLRRAPVVSGLRPDRLALLAAICRWFRVRAGEVVVQEGQAGSHGYIVVEGSFEVVVGGERQVVLGEGESFGILALLTGRPRLATVRALTGGELLAIERHDFEDLVMTHPGLVRSLSRQLARFARELG